MEILNQLLLNSFDSLIDCQLEFTMRIKKYFYDKNLFLEVDYL